MNANDEMERILHLLNRWYSLPFDGLVHLRDGGSRSYLAQAGDCTFFLRVTKPAFADTASHSVKIHVYLQNQGFPVPRIVFTREHAPSVEIRDESGTRLLILYEYIPGRESDPEQDTEAIGDLTGRFHTLMDRYRGPLVRHDRWFFLDRYLEILRRKQYPNVEAFSIYGNALWDRLRTLPAGPCHGDLYSGNIHKDPEGHLYLLDFDTVCEGFLMYDIALICNKTDFFTFHESRFQESFAVFNRFLPGYLAQHTLSPAEIRSFFDWIALYHFALEATIIEINGLDCVDNAFLDNQLEWLKKWRMQCKNHL